MEDQIQRKGHDERIVRYEQIHKIQDQDYQALIQAIDPRDSEVIFEGCAGYADVSKHIVEATRDFDHPPEIYLQDESTVQMTRAVENLKLADDHMIIGDVRSTGLPERRFDKAVIKMGVHELPKGEQVKVFKEVYRILKAQGKFVIWELSLTPETQDIFQDIIRKKNELAGFDLIVKNRYLQRHDELVDLFNTAGFQNVKDEYSIKYTFDARGRFYELVSKERLAILKEKGEISEEDEKTLRERAQARLNELLDYIRQRVPEEMKEKLRFTDLGDNIEITVDKVIMSGTK